MTPRTGSRFLYEPFELATARIEAHEAVNSERWAALEHRLQGIERMLERQERRLWLAVYGAAALFAADRVYQMLQQLP